MRRAGAMRGHALFAFVCLIIAAALLLPLLPADKEASVLAAASGVWTASAAVDPACQDCGPAAVHGDGCRTLCQCQQLVPAVSAVSPLCLSLTVYLVVQPLPPGRFDAPGPLPPKLPAI
jgi:hypothetical protein